MIDPSSVFQCCVMHALLAHSFSLGSGVSSGLPQTIPQSLPLCELEPPSACTANDCRCSSLIGGSARHLSSHEHRLSPILLG